MTAAAVKTLKKPDRGRHTGAENHLFQGIGMGRMTALAYNSSTIRVRNAGMPAAMH